MSNTEKIRELTYRLEEYERQKKQVREHFETIKDADNRKYTLSLYGDGNNFQVTLTDDSAVNLVERFCEWCDWHIEDAKQEIRNCLTSSEECDTLKSHS